VSGLESLYAMSSVSLDEAFSARGSGALVLAREQVAVSAELTERLGNQLLEALKALDEHSRKSRKFPQVTPLNADFFRGTTGRRVAAMQEVMHSLVPTRRARFIHKLEALEQTVREVSKEYREAAEQISEGASTDPATHWEALDLLHYDLNTCLRETIVVLKSFLLALSSGQFEAFQERLAALAQLMPSQLGPGVSGAST